MRVTMLDLLAIVPYYTGYLCRDLSKRGVNVTLASVTYHLDLTWFQRVGVPNHPGLSDLTRHVNIRPRPLRQLIKAAECLLNLAAQWFRIVFAKPDILHVQFLPLLQSGAPFELWTLRWARFNGVKVVYTVHNVLPHDTGPAMRRVYAHLYRNLTNALIAHDVITKERLENEFRIPPSKIHVIPHGPLFGERSPQRSLRERERLGVAQDTCIVACQGILRPYKGIPFLLDAWRLVAQEEPDALLRIAGTGDQAIVDDVRKKVADLGLEKSVRLDLRFLSVDEVEDCLDSADILVYPYREITTSGALLTGVNYAKAVVATRQPAFDLLLQDEHNALLVAYSDVEGLAQSLLRLIRDPALRHQLGANLAKADFQAVGWGNIAEQTWNCYQGVLDSTT